MFSNLVAIIMEESTAHRSIAIAEPLILCFKVEYIFTHPILLIEKLKLPVSHDLGSEHLKDGLFPYVPSQPLQSAENDLLMVPAVPQIQVERALKEMFSLAAPRLRKSLPLDIRQPLTLNIIRKRCKNFFFQKLGALRERVGWSCQFGMWEEIGFKSNMLFVCARLRCKASC